MNWEKEKIIEKKEKEILDLACWEIQFMMNTKSKKPEKL